MRTTTPLLQRPAFRRLRLGVLAALCPAALSAQGPFSSITFFGDSYVDTGNAFIFSRGAQPSTPPYAPGRFSNGLVFTDYLAASLGRPGDANAVFAANSQTGTYPASGNYAVGGSRTDNAGGTGQQIGAYLTRPGATGPVRTDPNGLYVLFVGGNDLRDAGNLADAAARQAAAATAAQNVITQASQLAGLGARNVLLFSLPSLGATPESRSIPGRSAIADQLALTFNSTLAAGITGLQTRLPGATFLNFRLDNLYANILADAMTGGARYGLTNLTVPCLAPFAPSTAPSCDVSVFADALHPTTRVHQIFGSSVATYVTTGQNVAVIPEPATVLLFGAGAVTLAGFAARRRRDRAA